MKTKLLLILLLTMVMITCESPIDEDETIIDPLNIETIVYASPYSRIYWEEADSTSFFSYRLEESSNGVDYTTVVEKDDVHSSGFTWLQATFDQSIWYRVVLVTIDSVEIAGPAYESNFISQFAGNYSLKAARYFSSAALNESLVLGDNSEWSVGSLIGTNLIEWTSQNDTSGNTFQLDVFEDYTFEFSGDTLGVLDTAELEYALHYITDSGEWSVNPSNYQLMYDGSHFTQQWNRWALTFNDGSEISLVIQDSLEVKADVLSPDSSETFQNVDLMVVRQTEAIYIRE